MKLNISVPGNHHFKFTSCIFFSNFNICIKCVKSLVNIQPKSVRHSVLSLTEGHPANLSSSKPFSLKTFWSIYVSNVCVHYHFLTVTGVTMNIQIINTVPQPLKRPRESSLYRQCVMLRHLSRFWNLKVIHCKKELVCLGPK